MASLVKSLQRGYTYLIDEAPDQRTNHWFLVYSPWPILALLIFYHNFVYRIGPAFMRNRKPFNIDRIVQIYNIIQVALCSWFVIWVRVRFASVSQIFVRNISAKAVWREELDAVGARQGAVEEAKGGVHWRGHTTWKWLMYMTVIKYISVTICIIAQILPGAIYIYGPTGAYGLSCQGIDRSRSYLALKLASFGWGYFMMKVFDLMDTIFFVLRKKTSQVTFLHVYHHMGMVFLSWFGTKYLPGGQGYYLVFINSFVHALMYSYYFISNYNPEYRKQIWWKKYLTQLQMFQFLTIFIQYGRVLFEPECSYPRWPIYVFLPQNFVILYLFVQFYRKAYMTPKEGSVNDKKKT